MPTKSKQNHNHHADHSEDLTRLRRIRGQIEGVERMIEEGRYCIDILHQTRSIMAALRSAEGLIMERHVRHCVKDAIEARDSRQSEQKINELMTIFQKR
jgi:CsoR family transcriptional regulator, copper-sensing transcriptional repressor